MKKVLTLIVLVGIVLAFMGRPGPPPHGPHPMPRGPMPQSPMCTACHEPKSLSNLVKTGIPVQVSGYVIDQKLGFIVIMNKMDVYHIKIRPYCGNVLGYKVTVRGVETLRGKGNTFTWHLIMSSSCPTVLRPTKESTVTSVKFKLVKVSRPECSSCHKSLLLHDWKRVSKYAEARVYVFYTNGTYAVAIGDNAFWHLEGCKVSAGMNTVRGIIVEEGSGISPYKVLVCSR